MSCIFILGGDGYCGWPLTLNLCSKGYKVIIIDSLVRRKIDSNLNISSLTPIASIEDRIYAAKEHGFDIEFVKLDISDNKQRQKLKRLLSLFQPEWVVNMAHQRSVPYSSIDYDKSSWTLENTTMGLFSLLEAIREISKNTKIIHLGSLGVFGYKYISGGITVGRTNVSYQLKNEKIYHTNAQIPFSPDSIYHLSKSINAQINEYYSRLYNIKIVDIYQATVWGCNVEYYDDERLINRLDYDSVFGTVVNRFCYHSITDKCLTIYGTGSQQRGFINIEDAVAAISDIISKNHVISGKVDTRPLVSEVCSVQEIATILSNRYGANIRFVQNPRTESETEFSVSESEYMYGSIKLKDDIAIDKYISFIEQFINK